MNVKLIVVNVVGRILGRNVITSLVSTTGRLDVDCSLVVGRTLMGGVGFVFGLTVGGRVPGILSGFDLPGIEKSIKLVL